MSDYDLIEVAQRGVPIVLVGRYVAELVAQSVYLGNEYSGYLATQHLLEHGHTRIGHITGPLSLRDSRDRLAGYRRALEAAGLPYRQEYVVQANFQEEEGLDARITAWTNEWYEGFKSGTVATQLPGAWLLGHLQNWMAPETAGLWGAANTPNDIYVSWGGSFYGVPEQSQNKEAARQRGSSCSF